jgi:hypothetical protein
MMTNLEALFAGERHHYLPITYGMNSVGTAASKKLGVREIWTNWIGCNEVSKLGTLASPPPAR